MANGQLIFVSGGVRSGKSAWAERRIQGSAGTRKVYLASGQAHDPEMVQRIHRHQEDRKEQDWITIEQPLHLEKALPFIEDGDAVLWDCATTWLANELYEGWEKGASCAGQPGCMEQKWANLKNTIHSLQCRTKLLVIVSNEVLDDFVRDDTYQRWLGRIHIWIAAQADEAYEMENGMAQKRK
ncbi:bifunctional adenosylcobinamide kinase/adenosylcobinamide-phosphate guanylyltransferase [Planococcus sp. 107-1]|uniref:bifunctional adenosylcobinamide kinase/adenosylcobinamide-phosphate guanylyltransferase n=1 Tax=Planococcus sp. 107-1 TaxID=2908840 RepID=UPI001F18720B|nr:bifunctional adenosylcobinamide kinase/adenosylcobinamide-phosphate guanylyltransferase [Planococcus sp. 107-1]UJF26296.1 bifunctional adenosylcobinamide kinase/adenosylcobinamide-phosphate guanylyltransferase [Planococcus sp. 107-1]